MTGDSPLRATVGDSGVGFPKPSGGPQSLSSRAQAPPLTETVRHCRRVDKSPSPRLWVSSVLTVLFGRGSAFSWCLGNSSVFQTEVQSPPRLLPGLKPLFCSLGANCKTRSSKESPSLFLSSNLPGTGCVEAGWTELENPAAVYLQQVPLQSAGI